jgi:uncharacterized iron-regulated membrane protein
MIRKTLFWLHFGAGMSAGLFIFIMAATGVALSFERQIIEFVDRDLRTVSVLNEARPRSLNELLETVRRAEAGEPTAIILRPQPQAATQFSLGRSKTVYVDPYSGAVLGVSSPAAHEFFFAVERWHRALGAPLGSKSLGHWLAAVSNLLFSTLIVLGIVLWTPHQWNRKAVRAAVAFRSGLRGRAREWNWHNVLGIWCALPLLVIALTGVVMSFDWANTLLFRLTGSTPPASGRTGRERRPHDRSPGAAPEPNYDQLFAAAKTLNPDWRIITINLVHDGNAPVPTVIDTGTGRQPQKRAQYLLNRETGAVVKTTRFADGSLGQRLRAFVRFGHTGEYGGWAGQTMAAIASFAACVLAYTGLSLAIRRFAAKLKRRRQDTFADREAHAEQPVR